MNNKMIFPNCSTIVWKLKMETTTKEKIIKALEGKDGETFSTQTDTFPNGCLGDMLMLFEEVKEKDNLNEIELVFVDNIGGGGNGEFVENCFEIAKRYLRGEVTKKQAKELERRDWNKEDE